MVKMVSTQIHIKVNNFPLMIAVDVDISVGSCRQ